MLKKVLIANRGEIALRITRACRELGIRTVAAYTRVDRDLKHLDLTDEHVCVAESSYLDIAAMTMAARNSGCDAVHPGYGFLSENAAFAEAVTDSGLVFIGPRATDISRMADKVVARRLAVEHGLTVLAGSVDAIADETELQQAAQETGYPLLLKARGGGGGRGIRLVSDPGELTAAFRTASQEALAAFADSAMYIERFLPVSRHIEVQVAGDGEGGAVHFGTRDCSLQRSQQKVIEEAPAPAIAAAHLADLCEQARRFTRDIRYRGLGTLEFLYDGTTFHFIEMNTRLQVEHPVTEMVTGTDLVQLQLCLAGGQALPEQNTIVMTGHAIECRINAEDAEFRPSPGLVSQLHWPGGAGVRIDSHLYAGYHIPHHYDSLVAKLIVHGLDRTAAIARATAALGEAKIEGVATSIPLLQKLLASDDFGAASMHTRSIEQSLGR